MNNIHRSLYHNTIEGFLADDPDRVLGKITRHTQFDLALLQRDAWRGEVDCLREALAGQTGRLYLEFSIPRMGTWADVVLLLDRAIVVVEFKVGESRYHRRDIDQVTDYALDLLHFHQGSHNRPIFPVLVCTGAEDQPWQFETVPQPPTLYRAIRTNGTRLAELIGEIHRATSLAPRIDPDEWEQSSYSPTPTIIEAAKALYQKHAVAEIARSDAAGEELARTTDAILQVIDEARRESQKAVCFVTGVPGSGKTLIGLNVATQTADPTTGTHSVFLSGNGPLVKILQEALARDKVAREQSAGKKLTIKAARGEVKAFVQNVHHYRDENLRSTAPPADHVALFDEAQRAWTLEQTRSFMQRKKGIAGFAHSEPEFLLSCVDRHRDWGVVVCLVGGGQEINVGEAGISEWIASLNRAFPEWHVHISDRLTDSEYGAGEVLQQLQGRAGVHWNPGLHLSVSMRSYRAEHVSQLVKEILDLDADAARQTLAQIGDRYPIVLTRDLEKAKAWLRSKAQGSERYGIVCSSQAYRLKPLAIDVRLQPNPVHWFLSGKDDIRSSYYLEDVATEFDIQGLELDWACVTWDADLRHTPSGWRHHNFRGTRWQQMKKPERQMYLKNAYRVLLTRARQGMVICVPEGCEGDPTRDAGYYDGTFEYLKGIGLPCVKDGNDSV